MGQASKAHSIGFTINAPTMTGQRTPFEIFLPNITFKGDIIQ